MTPTSTTQATSQATSGTIASRTMLVSIRCSRWSGRRVDKKVSREVAQQHGTSDDAGKYQKRLVAAKALDELEKIGREAWTYQMAHTLPWLDEGVRIIPAALYFDYVQQMKGWQRAYEDAADRFASAYPQVIEDARRELNGLFDPSDYPAPRTIRGRFGFRIVMMPLPDQGDFRVDLGDAEVARLQEEFTQARNEVFSNTIRDVVDRIHEVVARMSERLHAYRIGEDGKAEGVFRDSLVENVRELAAVLPALNVTCDDKLDDLIERVRASLTKHDASTLRESDAARAETVTAADEILEAVNAFFA